MTVLSAESERLGRVGKPEHWWKESFGWLAEVRVPLRRLTLFRWSSFDLFDILQKLASQMLCRDEQTWGRMNLWVDVRKAIYGLAHYAPSYRPGCHTEESVSTARWNPSRIGATATEYYRRLPQHL